MYPSRDFRTLINSHDPSLAIRAISREPFSELLKYWKHTGRPESLKRIYDLGIEEAVSKDRYTSQTLDLVSQYPEFYLPVSLGLRRLWVKFKFRLIFETPEEPYLSIESKYHTDDQEYTDFATEDKMRVLVWVKHKFNILMVINGIEYRVGIFPSRRAEEVIQKISWLDSALVDEKKNERF